MKSILKHNYVFLIIVFFYLLFLTMFKSSLLFNFYYSYHSFFLLYFYYLTLIRRNLPSFFACVRYKSLLICYLNYWWKFTKDNLFIVFSFFVLTCLFNYLFQLPILFTNYLSANWQLFMLGEVYYLVFALLFMYKSFQQHLFNLLFLTLFLISRININYNYFNFYNLFAFYHSDITFSLLMILHYLFWLVISFLFFLFNKERLKK